MNLTSQWPVRHTGPMAPGNGKHSELKGVNQTRHVNVASASQGVDRGGADVAASKLTEVPTRIDPRLQNIAEAFRPRPPITSMPTGGIAMREGAEKTKSSPMPPVRSAREQSFINLGLNVLKGVGYIGLFALKVVFHMATGGAFLRTG